MFVRTLSIFLIVPAALYSQSITVDRKSEKIIAEISGIIKKNSLFKDSIDWKKLSEEEKLLTLSDNDSMNKSLIFDFFTKKLRKSGDAHSFFLTKRTTSYIKQKTELPQPRASYLNDNIGIIKVPYCLSLDNDKDKAFANEIRYEIKRIDTGYTIKGWIVDLRQNVGGNMWPMLAGLNALTEDGTVGYFIYPNGKSTAWTSKNGRINFPMRKMDDYKIRNLGIKIAVLIDSLTGSSGEMTAISFIGLPNVRVFGQPSAGLTTGNKFFPLSDGNQLILAVNCAADRTGKKYQGKIIPDLIVNAKDSSHDETIEAAKNWLLGIEYK